MIREYKELKMPGDMQEGLMFRNASSKQLDVFAERVGIVRRRFLFAKEPDYLFRIRIRNEAIRRR